MRRALMLTPLALLACNGGGDDGDGDGGTADAMVLDAQSVRDHADRFAALFPGCTAVDGGVDSGVDSGVDTVSLPPTATPVAGTGSTGSCGGSLDVAYDHGDGDTTYDLLFNDFCVSSDSSEVTLNGQVVGFEDGTPSDVGPVVDRLTVDSQGPVTAAMADSTVEVEVTGVEITYGDPQAWEPGTPTADAPDVLTATRIVAAAPGSDTPTMTLTGLQAERVGDVPELSVLAGTLDVEGEGTLQVSTLPGQPLTLESFVLGGGVIVLEGADDAVLELHTVPDQPFVLDFQLDGAPLDLALDCSEAGPVVLELLPALWAALPLY